MRAIALWFIAIAIFFHGCMLQSIHVYVHHIP